ncbi:hypothetical protein BVG19_g4600 [[Candida] boidinii]|nr:hypothetical protein BVG19_g4600 [[Candida] boidinii]OWB51632.1 hypothetical protein B5S27_g3197 [[Candida] boidinii]
MASSSLSLVGASNVAGSSVAGSSVASSSSSTGAAASLSAPKHYKSNAKLTAVFFGLFAAASVIGAL